MHKARRKEGPYPSTPASQDSISPAKIRIENRERAAHKAYIDDILRRTRQGDASENKESEYQARIRGARTKLPLRLKPSNTMTARLNTRNKSEFPKRIIEKAKRFKEQRSSN